MEFKGISGLYKLIKKLRSPNGCPWDIKQTNETLKNDLIEETYEVIGAIENGDDIALKEELGDLLFLVLMHIRIKEEEENKFTLEDVVDGVINKMIYRHPHVFKGVKFKNEEELLKNWEKSKKGKSIKEFPANQPALLGFERLVERIKRLGMSESDLLNFCEKANSELTEIVKGALKIIKENRSPEDELRAFIKQVSSQLKQQ